MQVCCEWCNKIFKLTVYHNVNKGVFCSQGCRDADGIFRYMCEQEYNKRHPVPYKAPKRLNKTR